MSAPQIPNLNTFRRGGLRSRGRGDGNTTYPGRLPTIQGSDRRDEIIRNTDNDAAASRLSAVETGYLEDPFAKLFFGSGEVTRRLPLMNRGTFVRTWSIDRVVETFLSSTTGQRRQIISLGAGSDTRFFRLKRDMPKLDLSYHEIDFEANTRRKIEILRNLSFVQIARELCKMDLLSQEFQVLEDGARLNSPDYNIHSLDLRKLDSENQVLSSVDRKLPTLVISECCLIYLPPTEADTVLQYFTELFAPKVPLSIVIYEPIRPHDAFGRTMISNLTARGIHLQTLEKYAGLKEQRDRLRNFGFHDNQSNSGAEAADVDYLWRQWVNEKEKERVENLEWMDETEEFVLLAKHYSVSWSWRGFTDSSNWHRLEAPVDYR